MHVGSKARGTDYILPSQALAVERLYRAGETIILPDPGSVRLNGRIQAAQYLLLFARADNPRDFPVPFPYPQTPRSVKHVVSGNARKPKPVRPNEPCPIWLHDSYVESTRDARVARKENEPLFWRTWHAMIDPVYWCYYDHEHGSYPGYYRPMFGYTAWKTRDESTPHKRQIETHRGFKIFTYPFYDQNRFAVITVHMHASLRRRFYTRHHTMIFTILDRNWNIEMELHMKLDFGFAAVTLKNGKNMPLGKEDEQIIKELHSNARMRRFNVLNLKNYPKNLDSKYEMKNNVPPTMKNERLISLGTYERWVAPPNTCSGGRNGRPVPFNFDFRHVATSIQDIKRYKTAPMQRLHGSSIDRMLLIGGDVGPLDVAKRLCKFEGGNMPSADLFYTDPYFKRLERQSGRNSVRNFWRMGFKGVRFSLGKMTPVDVWAGHYEMEKRKEDRRHMQLERAVIADVN